ncbi:MAG: hypothetical protein WBV64_08815 [Mycobacterium sp.]
MRHLAPLFALAAAGFLVPVPAHADPAGADQASAELAVTAIYNERQYACTPQTPPQVADVEWSRFDAGAGGEGTIIDVNDSIGGPFAVYYTNPRVGPATDDPSVGRAYGQWNVDLQFC